MLLSAIFLYGILAQQMFVVTIVGGTLCECPHLVSLQLGKSQHFCSGSIIKDNDYKYTDKILTTAQCVENTYNFSICTGNNLRHGECYFPKKICIHPDNNVAVIKLTKEIQSNHSAIPLANSSPAPGTICTLCGWGEVNENDELVPICQEINKTISKCEENDVPSNHLCADNSHKIDNWQGDPGASLVCEGKLSGMSEIYCNDDSCSIDEPDIYFNVTNYRDFINSCTDTS